MNQVDVAHLCRSQLGFLYIRAKAKAKIFFSLIFVAP